MIQLKERAFCTFSLKDHAKEITHRCSAVGFLLLGQNI